MKTIPPIKKISTFLLCISIFSSSFAQTLEIVENQPEYDYAEAFETEDNIVFTDYYGGTNPAMYNFDGINFQSIPFEDYANVQYLDKYNNKYYFAQYDPIASLMEYDGSQVISYNLPEGYENPVFLGNFNNRLFIVGQNYLEGDIILGFNGNELEEFEVPNQREIIGYYFSENNQSLYLILRDNQQNNPTSAWVFDGENYTVIPNPQEKEIVSIQGEIDGVLTLACIDVVNTDIFSLYSFDGTNLTALPTSGNTSLSYKLGSNNQQIFFRYKNLASEKGELYGFDGNGLNPIYTNLDKDAYLYGGNFNNEDYFIFSMYNSSSQSHFYKYDGVSFTAIGVPENLSAVGYATSTDEKLYMVYEDTEENYSLTELTLGETTATLVSNPPENYSFSDFLTSYGNTLFYSYESDSEQYLYKLYAVDQSGFVEVVVPENAALVDYEFTLDQDLYFNYLNQQTNTTQLYKINGNDLGRLEAVETNQNIIVSPNPANGYFKVHFTDATIAGEVKVNLFSISGKLINAQDFTVSGSNPEIFYPTESLTSGVYVMEVISSSGRAIERVVVQ
ncbi:T9SS type A sorting domain-containing protein [Marixanthomonas ophiurae]|uniref:T9SS C-terminal target domain-containing protein n=1 Tax=Marixanthomonas ophiurae TaxID=387659 RepID=A0A3E1QB29_9FLAO|nr:T9SS type A sorting domain-containing protein [Marixanthomonas ophiurae]RFN59342.1 T9SS C-terminal target domain-containing protein [Marixanthomonas ophiurae]